MTLRGVQISDAEAAARLSEELGYPVTREVMEQRIHYVLQRDDRIVFVACLQTEVTAWIDVSVGHHLQSGPYAEVGGFVVSSSARGLGIGRQLLAAAEKWAAGKGIGVMLVRSQIKRARAHRFYLREGYTRTKTSAVFEKSIPS